MTNNSDSYNLLSFKSIILRFIKNSSIYGFFIFLSRFGTFFVIPIYWYFLTPKDYGILGVTTVLHGVLNPVINLGLNSSAERFYYEWGEGERKKKLGTLWLISILIALFFVFIIEATANLIFPFLFKQVTYYPYFQIMLWTVLFNSFRTFPFSILRITENAKAFGIISFLSFITHTIIVVFFLFLIDLKVIGFLLGGLVNGICWAIFWIVWMSKKINISLNIFNVKEEFLYSLPSLPINLIDSIGRNFDRYILEKYLGLIQLGYYNLGKRFGDYYNQVNSSLKTAWFPMAYKMISRRKELTDILPSLSLFYFFILTIFGLSSSLLLKEIIYWFGKSKFIEAYQYVPLFILYYLILNFATAWGRGLDLAKKPQYALISTISSVVVGIVLLYFLTPEYGAYGAIVALLISSLIRTSIFVLLAHFFYPRKFLIKENFFLCVLLASTFYSGYKIDIDSTILSFIMKIFIIMMYTVIGSFVTFGYKRIINQFGQIRQKKILLKSVLDWNLWKKSEL
jgi:O-antigen/teichoic acid export membrane protein